MKKHYIDAQKLLNDSLELAIKIVDSGFKPDIIVGVWRGGTPVAIAIQEALQFMGLESDHISIKTKSYKGIDTRGPVKVDGLDYLITLPSRLNAILLVDDIFDTGLSLEQVIVDLKNHYKDDFPIIKIATPYYKPNNNQTSRMPDFYLHETSKWVVFPHELLELSNQEILTGKAELHPSIEKILQRRKPEYQGTH